MEKAPSRDYCFHISHYQDTILGAFTVIMKSSRTFICSSTGYSGQTTENWEHRYNQNIGLVHGTTSRNSPSIRYSDVKSIRTRNCTPPPEFYWKKFGNPVPIPKLNLITHDVCVINTSTCYAPDHFIVRYWHVDVKGEVLVRHFLRLWRFVKTECDIFLHFTFFWHSFCYFR